MIRNSFGPMTLGPMNVSLMQQTLNVTLVPGSVHLTARVHEKIATKHAPDYRFVLDNAPIAIASPTYVGLNPDHEGRVDFILEVGTHNPLLVAVGTAPRDGRYMVSTSFRTFSATVSQWLRKGWLVKPK